jgi:hypothetical protein
MADGMLFKPGKFMTHRTLGTVAADSATINATNFPLSGAFAGTQCQSVWITWHGTGGATTDTLKVVPLMWDGINTLWCKMSEITLTKDTVTELKVYGATLMFLRVSDVTGVTATAPITINLAKADSAIVE